MTLKTPPSTQKKKGKKKMSRLTTGIEPEAGLAAMIVRQVSADKQDQWYLQPATLRYSRLKSHTLYRLSSVEQLDHRITELFCI